MTVEPEKKGKMHRKRMHSQAVQLATIDCEPIQSRTTGGAIFALAICALLATCAL